MNPAAVGLARESGTAFVSASWIASRQWFPFPASGCVKFCLQSFEAVAGVLSVNTVLPSTSVPNSSSVDIQTTVLGWLTRLPMNALQTVQSIGIALFCAGDYPARNAVIVVAMSWLKSGYQGEGDLGLSPIRLAFHPRQCARRLPIQVDHVVIMYEPCAVSDWAWSRYCDETLGEWMLNIGERSLEKILECRGCLSGSFRQFSR